MAGQSFQNGQTLGQFFEPLYVVVDGKRFYMSHTVGWNKLSLVHAVISRPLPIDKYGEVLEILQINQDF